VKAAAQTNSAWPSLRAIVIGAATEKRVLYVVSPRYHQRNTPHRKRFPLDQSIAKKVGNTRACGSQRRAAGVPEAVRTALYFSESPRVTAACRWNCGAMR